MKNLFNKLKRLFVILLVIPMTFIFAACGGKGKNNNPDTPTGGIEQPGGNDNQTPDEDDNNQGGEDDEQPSPEVQTNNFSVELDYNLPTYLADLLPKESKTAKVENGYTLPTFEETEYFEYFDGWYNLKDEKIEELTILGTKDSVVKVKAKWKELDLKNYFYTAGLEFETNDEDSTAAVINYLGTNSIVVIPQVYVYNDKNYFVESVGINSFKDNNVVKEIRTYLSDFYVNSNAFENSSLEKIEFSKISSIGKSAFQNSKITRATFSNKLIGISESTFENCAELTSVDFSSSSGQGLAALPKNLFKGCTSLSQIFLSTSTTSVGLSTFEGCSSIENLNFIENSSVTKLGNKAFAGCLKLDKVVMPEQIVSYGTMIFNGCLITEMTTPIIYDDIYNGAGVGFTITFGDLSSTLKKVTLTDAAKNFIPKFYFENYYNLRNLIMNDSIIKVENKAFNGCVALESIDFSAGLDGDDINISAFESTAWYSNIDSYLQENSLNELVINNTLIYVSSLVEGDYEISDEIVYIAENVFASKTGIASVSIPASVEYININAFKQSSIESILVDSDNQNYGCTTGTFFVESGGSYDETDLAEYSALYELDDSGNEVALIAYAATNYGGTFIIPNSVGVVYDIAFNLKYAPEYVFVYSESAQIIFDYGSNVSYIFENSNITTENVDSTVKIYKFLAEEHYTKPEIIEDADYDSFNFVSNDDYNLIILIETDDFGFGGELKSYYLVDHLDQTVEIY